MTGGRIVCLGETGINFAAGMSGGVAYIYDPSGSFPQRCNMEMVSLESVASEEEETELRSYVEAHHAKTGSAVAAGVLDRWDASLPAFVKVMPNDYKRVLKEMAEEAAAAERSAAAA